MLSPNENDDIRRAVHNEMAELEDMADHRGSYRFICETPTGYTFLAHRAVGRVLRHFDARPV